MRNIDKVWSVWRDLDAAWAKQRKSKKEFLLQLIANGDKEKILAMLAKVAGDIETADDNKIYTTLQSLMFLLVNNYSRIPEDIISLQEYIATLEALETQAAMVSFDELVGMISMAKPNEIRGVEFDLSPVGMEFITADSIHKVNLVSSSAVMLPAWVQSEDQLPLTDSKFHKTAANFIRNRSMARKQQLLIDGEKMPINKRIITQNNRQYLECGNIELEIEVI